jgi:hypothetical protein
MTPLSVSLITFLNLRQHDCPICLVAFLPDDRIAAHEKGGENHPFHKHCLMAWLANRNICPSCNQLLDPKTCLPLKERVVFALRTVDRKPMPWIAAAPLFVGFNVLLGKRMALCYSQSHFFSFPIVLSLFSSYCNMRIGTALNQRANDLFNRDMIHIDFRVAISIISLLTTSLSAAVFITTFLDNKNGVPYVYAFVYAFDSFCLTLALNWAALCCLEGARLMGIQDLW